MEQPAGMRRVPLVTFLQKVSFKVRWRRFLLKFMRSPLAKSELELQRSQRTALKNKRQLEQLGREKTLKMSGCNPGQRHMQEAEDVDDLLLDQTLNPSVKLSEIW